MWRSLISAAKAVPFLVTSTSQLALHNAVRPTLTISRNFSLLRPQTPSTLLNNGIIAAKNLNYVNTRSVIKYSIRKGKRKTVKTVLKRFYRLHWGIWIRRIAGSHKKLWKKSPPRKRRLRQHVFCNATQSFMLDKMVGSYWRKPKYYVDDPYGPYHTREEFKFTYRKPKPYFPPESS